MQDDKVLAKFMVLNKRKLSVNQMLLMVALITAIIIVGEWYKPDDAIITQPTNADSCTFSNGTCRFILFDTPATLAFSVPEIPIEQEVILTLETDLELENVSATISGLNMFMGEYRVRFSRAEGGEYQAIVMLGACSEPNMKWLMTFEADYGEKKQKTHGVFQTFIN